MAQNDDVDPVAIEIANLKRALLGELAENQAANDQVIDQALSLARAARVSRPGMRAVSPDEPITGVKMRRETVAADVTSKFEALRVRK